MLLQDSSQMLVRNSVCVVSDDCSVYQASNQWNFAQWSKKLISKISEDEIRVPSVFAALGWHKQLQC